MFSSIDRNHGTPIKSPCSLKWGLALTCQIICSLFASWIATSSIWGFPVSKDFNFNINHAVSIWRITCITLGSKSLQWVQSKLKDNWESYWNGILHMHMHVKENVIASLAEEVPWTWWMNYVSHSIYGFRIIHLPLVCTSFSGFEAYLK